MSPRKVRSENKDRVQDESLWELAMQGTKPIHKVSNFSEPKQKIITKKILKNDSSAAKISKKPVVASREFVAEKATRINSLKKARPNATHIFSGIDKRNATRLRRGQLPIDSKLDMHGMKKREAYDALRKFIFEGVKRGNRCVLVVTGKGSIPREREDQEPKKKNQIGILKESLPDWLKEKELAQHVVTHCEAIRHHGGSGARYLLLRKKR